MKLNYPTLAVIGRKNSGKTTVIEFLVPEIIKAGFSVATIKHISHKGFSIDSVGSDTWRHSAVGANPVIAFSDNEVDIMVKAFLPLTRVAEIAINLGADVLILEGFSSVVVNEEEIGKIICIRNMKEYEEFREKLKGEVIAFCSFYNLGEPILNIVNEKEIIIKRTLNFVNKKTAIFKILGLLGGLNCGKCGKESCEEMAKEIHGCKASFEDCIIVRNRSNLRARVLVNGEEIPLQPFVSEFIRRTVLGMISSLKNVNIEGDERVHIEVFKRNTFKLDKFKRET